MKMLNTRVRAAEASDLTVHCSISDLLLKNLAVSVVFMFEGSVPFEPLVQGLREALGAYPIYAGTLVKAGDGLCIRCDNSGVPFSVVHSDESLDDVMAKLADMPPSELIDVIDPRKAVSQGSAVLTFRLTYFRGGGTCLGVSRHHAIGDLHSYMCLMRAWTAAVAGVDFERPLIVEDRDAFLAAELGPSAKQTVGLRHLDILDLVRLGVYKTFRARQREAVLFYFAPSELLKMQREQREAAGERLSKNDVLTAHMFSLIEQRDPQERTRQLAVTVNYRARAGLPANLLGNIVSSINLRCDPGTPSIDVARRLRNGVNNYATEHMNYLSNVAFVHSRGGLKHIGRFIPAGLDPTAGNLLVTNWSKSGVYDVEFDGQRPFLYLHAGKAPIPWISAIVEGPYGEGRIYMGMLPTPIVRALVSEEGLSAVHAYRDPAERLPELIGGLPWLR